MKLFVFASYSSPPSAPPSLLSLLSNVSAKGFFSLLYLPGSGSDSVKHPELMIFVDAILLTI